ncbi:MAG: hypothetical protein OSJ72_11885 [Lachnospiraceae bacterium]|nr:hypothetical protein [Lachnospiraceae bacterium]
MGYTRAHILEQCKGAFQDKNTFYKQGFINYRGKSSDTKEFYTEIIAEFLCYHITEYKTGINCIMRESSYKTKGHDGEYDPASNREEEKIAMDIFNLSNAHGPLNLIGRIIDYQTPLKSNANDEAGKIDLLSFDGKTMRILELKKPDSKETMLRCVLEGYTYLQTVCHEKLIKDFECTLRKDFLYNPEDVEVKANPFVFYDGEQFREMSQHRPYLHNLMALLDSKPYYIKELDEKYIVVEG